MTMQKPFSVNGQKMSVRCLLYSGEKQPIHTLIVFGHGFGGHKENRTAARLAERILEKNRGTALLAFDWPCHGEDARKKLTLEECDASLRLVLGYARDRWAPVHLYGYGVSFGGWLFLYSAAKAGNPFDRLLLRAPAVTMYDSLTHNIISPEEMQQLERGKSVPAGFDRKVEISAAFLRELKDADLNAADFSALADSCLILHGTKDTVIPLRDVQAFAAKNGLDLMEIENADHRFSDPRASDEATAWTMDFFELK